jgi:hypothetical protein
MSDGVPERHRHGSFHNRSKYETRCLLNAKRKSPGTYGRVPGPLVFAYEVESGLQVDTPYSAREPDLSLVNAQDQIPPRLLANP